MKRIGLIVGALCLFSGAAQAALITNLDDKPHVIGIETGSGDEDVKPITIAPGETTRIDGIAEVRYNHQRYDMREDEEYAIWKGGDMNLQKRQTNYSSKTR